MNIKKLLLILIIYCSLFIPSKRDCFAQSITWQRTYDHNVLFDEIGYDVCEANGTNFYIVGYANNMTDYIWVLKINQYGDTLWTRSFFDNFRGIRALAVVSSEDGGCVLTGSWDSSFTIKIDSNGNTVWKKFYGGHNIQCYDIIKTYNGGYIICGEDLNSHFDGYICKIDSSGQLQWQKIIPSTELIVFNSIIQETDKSYVLIGSRSNFPNDFPKALIYKIDSAGNFVFEKMFQANGYTSEFTNINKINDNYYLSGGNYYNQEFRVFFAKMDLQGNVIDTTLFYSNQNEYSPRMNYIESNKFILATTKDTTYPIPSFITLRLIDTLGNTTYQKSYNWTKDLEILSALPLQNGDLLFIGYCKNPFRTDIYALRTDSLLIAPPPIGIINNNPILPKIFKISNYPNPFNNSTIFNLEISVDDIYKFEIFDVLGRRIYELFNKKLKTGKYKLNFEAQNLSSGTYFYKLSTNKIFKSNKFIIIK